MADGFHEVRFPLRLSLNVTGGPVRRTDIVNLSNGREARNRRWRDSRRAYDAGSGMRSVADLYEVLSFFEARGGGLHGFRFRDPVDGKSCAPDRAVTPFDQVIGEGDGETVTFQLAKTYGDAAGEWRRVIAKPVAGTVRLAVDGVATGLVVIDEDYIPQSGALVRVGFEFDVPVRFDADRIDLNIEAFRAGRIPTIPLIEILP